MLLFVSTMIQQADLGRDLPAMVNIGAIIGSRKMTVDPSEIDDAEETLNNIR